MLKFDSDSCVKEFWHDICNEVIDSRLLDMKVCKNGARYVHIYTLCYGPTS